MFCSLVKGGWLRGQIGVADRGERGLTPAARMSPVYWPGEMKRRRSAWSPGSFHPSVPFMNEQSRLA